MTSRPPATVPATPALWSDLTALAWGPHRDQASSATVHAAPSLGTAGAACMEGVLKPLTPRNVNRRRGQA